MKLPKKPWPNSGGNMGVINTGSIGGNVTVRARVSNDDDPTIDLFREAAERETQTTSFRHWAGADRLTLAIVFTDVVGSTALGEALGDEGMNQVRRAHFARSEELAEKNAGRVIKTIGDSFLCTFASADEALDYARALHADTGHPSLEIRAGIHIGPMQIEENDIFGGTVRNQVLVFDAIALHFLALSRTNIPSSRPAEPPTGCGPANKGSRGRWRCIIGWARNHKWKFR